MGQLGWVLETQGKTRGKFPARGRAFFAGLALAAGLNACSTVPPKTISLSNTLPTIEAELSGHIAVLASDDFGGRQPGTEGEIKTLTYLTRQWQVAGLEPGTNNPASPWLSSVSLSVSKPGASSVVFYRRGKKIAVPQGSVIAYSSGLRALLDQAPMVFVGKQSEPLESSELTGRVAIMLWDHPAQFEQRDDLLAKGASAVLAIVQDDAELAALAGRRSAGSYRLADDNGGSLLDGFMSPAAAEELFGGATLANWRRSADSDGFLPVTLDSKVSIEATATSGKIETHNLVARLPGARPDAGAVLVMAHWDHFGICAPAGAADRICNGAVDNASGLAVLIELARRLGAGPKPDRDIYFVATTGEEWGLLGAQAFVADPPVPLSTIVAAFNVDSIAVAKRGAPVAIVGEGLTPLDEAVKQVVRHQGRTLGEETAAQEFLRRQDGWVLLQRDVPTLMVSSAYADQAALDRYTRDRYHRPSDQIEGIELGGAAQDLLLHLALLRHFSSIASWPGPTAPVGD